MFVFPRIPWIEYTLMIASCQQLHQRRRASVILQHPPSNTTLFRHHGRDTSYRTVQAPPIRQHIATTTPSLHLSHHLRVPHLSQPMGSRPQPPPHWLRRRPPRPHVRPLRPGSRCRLCLFLPPTPSSSSRSRKTPPVHHHPLRLVPHTKALGRL